MSKGSNWGFFNFFQVKQNLESCSAKKPALKGAFLAEEPDLKVGIMAGLRVVFWDFGDKKGVKNAPFWAFSQK